MTVTEDRSSGHPLGADQATPRPSSAREAVNDMLEAGLLDELMNRVDDGGLALTGEGGFIPEMIKAVLERGLQAELTSHLGYEKGDPAGRGSPNSRNGTTPKTLAAEVGDVALAVPRYRAGTFEPRLIPKGSRRAGGLDEMIISLYAGWSAASRRSTAPCARRASEWSPSRRHRAGARDGCTSWPGSSRAPTPSSWSTPG
jgi:putative transposase